MSIINFRLIVMSFALTAGCSLAPIAYSNVTFSNAKLILHAEPHTKGGGSCEGVNTPPCNADSSNVATSVQSGAGYDVYVFVLDFDLALGISSVSFGLDYDNASSSGLDVLTWASCSDLSFDDPSFPDSGTGTVLTWDAQANCQNTVPNGDYGGEGGALVGAMYVHAYDTDVLSITAAPNQGALLVARCDGSEAELRESRSAGKLGFGEGGYDPCYPYSPMSYFTTLSGSQLDSLQLRCMDRNGHYLQFTSLLSVAVPEDFQRFALYEDIIPYSSWTSANHVSNTDLATVIDSMAVIGIEAGEESGQFIVTMSVWHDGALNGFESSIGWDKASRFVTSLSKIFEATPIEAEIAAFGCATAYQTVTTASDVTDSVSFSYSGFRVDRTTNQYIGNVTVKNVSSVPLAGPLTITLGGSTGTQLKGYDGQTCQLPGRWYINILSSGSLDPDSELEVELRFTFHEHQDFPGFDTWLFSGDGPK